MLSTCVEVVTRMVWVIFLRHGIQWGVLSREMLPGAVKVVGHDVDEVHVRGHGGNVISLVDIGLSS